MGMNTSMPGQEGVPSVFSPMARTLNDLAYFTKSFLQMKPWKYDHTVHPLEWRDAITEEFNAKRQLKVGVLSTDGMNELQTSYVHFDKQLLTTTTGVVDPSPACERALKTVVSALIDDGHQVEFVDPPSAATPYQGLVLASQLLNSDGCRTFAQFFRNGEHNDPGAAQMSFYMRLPRPLKYMYYLWVRYVRRDPIWAGLLRHWHQKSAFEQWKLVAQREAYRAAWHGWWDQSGPRGGNSVDILLTVPNATPAVPHGGMHDAVSSCGYTFLFNLIDYTAGIIPVTHVDAKQDALSKSFDINKLNGVAKGAYRHYDAKKMEGLPVGVQVVGRRLEEEKVLAIMQRIEDALEKNGEGKYKLLEVD
jgi:Asp-tRNA(Asn)/Glu-tRNA(Gln) amidotransferase A subunit family amidase